MWPADQLSIFGKSLISALLCAISERVEYVVLVRLLVRFVA